MPGSVNKTTDSKSLDFVDGAWGEWSQWSDCSRNCRGGSKSRTRLCISVTPSLLGANCPGEDVEYSSPVHQLSGDQGEIKSLNYPEGYPENVEEVSRSY